MHQNKISKDKKYLVSGEFKGNNDFYMSQIILSFNSVNWGRFIISYFKDCYALRSSHNGILIIFFDYEQIKFDDISNKTIVNLYYVFPPGNHQILIIYKYYRTHLPMKLYIRSIELINIKDSPTECLKEEIKDKNFLCNVNYFYNETKGKCEQCKEGEFSLYGFNLKENKCIPKHKCTKYDKNIINISKCDSRNKNETIEYESFLTIFASLIKMI